MAEARRMGKSDLFSHFAERFEVKRTVAREYFDELAALAEKELKRAGEFTLPGLLKISLRKVPARKAGTMIRNPSTGEMVPGAAKPASVRVKIRALSKLKAATAS